MEPRRVLFVGDVNVDLILAGLSSQPAVDREVTCASFRQTLGSSCVIAAANYAGLGGSAAMAGLAGNDEYGRFMLEGMREHGIDTSLVDISESGRTGVTVSIVYASTRTQVTYPGTIATFTDTSRIEKNLPGFHHIHFSGVYQQHALRPKIEHLLNAARRHGLTASMDTQWDPTEAWELLDRWLPLLDCFFVNDDEARSITGESDAESAIEALGATTPCPVCKSGPNGAYVLKDGRVVHIPAFPVEVVDTTGAGDAFAAGLLYARIEKKMGLSSAALFASAVAARNCTEEGGVNTCPDYEAIIHFMESYDESTR